MYGSIDWIVKHWKETVSFKKKSWQRTLRKFLYKTWRGTDRFLILASIVVKIFLEKKNFSRLGYKLTFWNKET